MFIADALIVLVAGRTSWKTGAGRQMGSLRSQWEEKQYFLIPTLSAWCSPQGCFWLLSLQHYSLSAVSPNERPLYRRIKEQKPIFLTCAFRWKGNTLKRKFSGIHFFDEHYRDYCSILVLWQRGRGCACHRPKNAIFFNFFSEKKDWRIFRSFRISSMLHNLLLCRSEHRGWDWFQESDCFQWMPDIRPMKTHKYSWG